MMNQSKYQTILDGNMETHKSKWWARMVEVHGSEEAVRDFMRESNKRRTPTRTGGYHKLKETSPELHKQLSAKGGRNGKPYTKS